MATKEPKEREVDRLNREICAKLAANEFVELTETLLEQSVKCKNVEKTLKHKQATSWLHWARDRKHVKTVCAAIPAAILPEGCSGILYDVKVFSRGPDDAINDANKDIRDKVARGNCFLEITNGPEADMRCIVYALKKFTGGLGDDDDRDCGDNHTWKRYFIKPMEEAVSIVATKKANGEAAHLSARKLRGQIVICGGSKNVHLVFTRREDIDRYGEPRFTVAREVCHAVMDVLERMSPEDKERLLNYLCATEYTAIFEILNPTHQHVEDLSHLPRAELRFITWTSCELEVSPEAQLCSIPPHVSIELKYKTDIRWQAGPVPSWFLSGATDNLRVIHIARALGLPTVEYEVIPVADVDARMAEIRQGYGYEGEVLYFLDSSHAVIGLLKKKTIWYILCRAVREKLRAACTAYQKSSVTFEVSRSIRKVEKRVEEIRTWLGLDEESTAAWKKLGTGCMKWAIHKMESGELSMQEVADQFPATWKKYLADCDQTDKIQVKWQEPEGSDE